MILADENTHAAIIAILQHAGFEVFSVREHYSGISDAKVIEIARQNDWLLLTQDKDFGEWVFSHHIKDLSVLFLRFSASEYKEIASTLVNLLSNQPIERPFFATITTKKIRIRKL